MNNNNNDVRLLPIQRIYATMPAIHNYLKSKGYNTIRYAYFSYIESDRRSESTKERVLMLWPAGGIYSLEPEGDSYRQEKITDQQVIDAVVTIFRQEVKGKHPYLKPVLEFYMASNARERSNSPMELF